MVHVTFNVNKNGVLHYFTIICIPYNHMLDIFIELKYQLLDIHNGKPLTVEILIAKPLHIVELLRKLKIIIRDHQITLPKMRTAAFLSIALLPLPGIQA